MERISTPLQGTYASMKKVTIYTDGSCKKNPGPGGWAVLYRYNGKEKILSGGIPQTTNNQMELQACIEALKGLKEPCEVDLFTDSKYVIQGATEWLPKWKRNGWMTNAGPVKNQEFWVQLDLASRAHKINWTWVKGHSGDKDNDTVDVLAQAEAMIQHMAVKV